MTENQRKSPAKDVSLTPVFHTILAAENKTSELFVKSFQYQGENISTKHLGQIFGFFEIPDTQEDNAYIVNFLASVVKKEYFINPKRSATDSFEAALHKINLALTELVKQGNTSWLGKLHGVVSVIEGNAFHFSVTGDAAILLYRDQQVTLISEGLADKDAALHPLKTFLEISSGELLSQDKILVTSPELFTLCHQESLRKNAFRMDKSDFARYIRAALVNELPLGISIIIDLEPTPATTRPKKQSLVLREESREKLQNVFSSVPFVDNGKNEVPETVITEEEKKETAPIEYTDKKTGHIYVQGEPHNDIYKEPNSWQTFTQEQLRPLMTSLVQAIKRLSKKSRKAVAKNAIVIGAEGKELSRTLWKLSKEKSSLVTARSTTALKAGIQSIKIRQQEKIETEEENPDQRLPSEYPEEVASELPIHSFSEAPTTNPPEEDTFTLELHPEQTGNDDTPTKRQLALKRFSHQYIRPKKNTPTTSSFSSSVFSAEKLKRVLGSAGIFLQALSKKQKVFIVLFLLVGGAVIIGLQVWNSAPTATKTPEEAQPLDAPQTQETSEPTTSQLTNANQVASWETDESIALLATNDSVVMVTPKAVIFNTQTYPFVANGTIESAAYMPDLRIVFLWSSANELVSWSVVDQKFTANVFPLSANTQITDLGAYLTYLYALDANSGTIQRFARSEGGFGEPTNWLKTPLAKGSTSTFVVNDTIRIAGTTLDQYSKGAKEKTLSEETYQVLGTSSERTFTLAVETNQGNITIWNADGNKVYEGTHEELRGIQGVTYNESNKKLLVTKGQTLTEYSLSW